VNRVDDKAAGILGAIRTNEIGKADGTFRKSPQSRLPASTGKEIIPALSTCTGRARAHHRQAKRTKYLTPRCGGVHTAMTRLEQRPNVAPANVNTVIQPGVPDA